MKKHFLILALFVVNSILNIAQTSVSHIDSLVKIRENLYDDYKRESMKYKKDRDEIIKKLTNVVNFDNLLITESQKKIKEIDSTLEATQYNYNDIKEKYSKFEPIVKDYEKFTLILYTSIGAETLILLIFIIILYISRRKLKKVKFNLLQANQALENSETEKISIKKELEKSTQLLEKLKIDKYIIENKNYNSEYRQINPEILKKLNSLEEKLTQKLEEEQRDDKFELNLNKLEKLNQLKENNILNEEEFLKLKQKILDNL